MLQTRMPLKLACGMVLALALGTGPVAAQQRSTLAPEERGDLTAIRKVSMLIGTPVMGPAEATVAHIRDLALSPAGEVLYVVLGYGGLAGVGETDTAAPLDALEIRHASDGKWAAHLDMTADDLKKAPTIQSSNYRELADAQWIARVDQFFRPRAEKARPGGEATGPVRQSPRGAVERVLLASKIRSSQLKNPQNEDLGKIEDLLLDQQDRVAFLIVGAGGVLSIGEHYIPVPWSNLGLTTNLENAAVTASVNATKDQIEKAPRVKESDYATLLNPGFAKEVRRYFGATGRATSTETERERR
jgi:hypothetical protein